MSESLLVALGGNALIKHGQRDTLEEQRQNIDECLVGLLMPIQMGTRLIITHGNGPQVGYIWMRAQVAKDQAYDLPLDACVAQSQGEQRALLQRVITAATRLLEGERLCWTRRVRALGCLESARAGHVKTSDVKGVGNVAEEDISCDRNDTGGIGPGFGRTGTAPWPGT